MCMKTILRFFTVLVVVSALFACSKKSGSDDGADTGSTESPGNGWKLVSWAGSTAISGYVYLQLEEDLTFVLYQQVGDLATYGYRRYTGTYTLTEDSEVGPLLSGVYSDGAAWKDSYVVELRTEQEMRLRSLSEDLVSDFSWAEISAYVTADPVTVSSRGAEAVTPFL